MSLLKELQREITGKNREDKISAYEETISTNIESLVKSEQFFNLPLSNLLSIFSKINILEIDDIIPFMTNYINNTIKYHSYEKETIFLLPLIKTKENFTFDDIISILLSFTNCDIFKTLKIQYNDLHKDIEFDYEYELSQKNKEIEDLKATISKMKNEKQDDKKEDYIPSEEEIETLNQYKKMIDYKEIDPNKLDKEGKTLLHHACEYGYFAIVKYLVEDIKVDIHVEDSKGKTAIYYTLHEPDIFYYLKQHGARIRRGMRPRPLKGIKY